MTISTAIDDAASTDAVAHQRSTSWQNILFWLATLALFAVALWLRLRLLDLPFDRDGYDEGVYWQSLRSMSAGYGLYNPIFYSQPPMFLLSLYPIYMLFGPSVWSARLSVALISLLAIAGAFLLGRTLRGRYGALAAALLLTIDPLFLFQSQTIQAETPSLAFSILSLAFAYLWWQRPAGRSALLLAALSGITLSLSILSKLFGVATLVPLVLILLAQLWQRFRAEKRLRLADFATPLVFVLAFLMTTALIVFPFVGSFNELWSGVVTYHTDAGDIDIGGNSSASKLQLLMTMVISFTTLAAAYGTIGALLKRDIRVMPLLAWALVTALMLFLQSPLFPHHLVMLIPPLIALAVLGIDPAVLNLKHLRTSFRQRKVTRVQVFTALALLLLLLTTTSDLRGTRAYYRLQNEKAQALAQDQRRVLRDLATLTGPNDQVIVDAQFLLGVGNRNTPPELVDTSYVRIRSGYLTSTQLIAIAQRPQVKAVLFYTDRLKDARMKDFRSWLRQHYVRKQTYSGGKELWIKL